MVFNDEGDRSFVKRDDIVYFEIGKENKVQIIHDFSSAGYEQRKEYDGF